MRSTSRSAAAGLRHSRAPRTAEFGYYRSFAPLDKVVIPCETAGVKQSIVTLDLEGVLVPEIWIAVAEKTGIHDLFRRKFMASAGRLIRQRQRSAIRILIRAVSDASRIDANVVTA